MKVCGMCGREYPSHGARAACEERHVTYLVRQEALAEPEPMFTSTSTLLDLLADLYM